MIFEILGIVASALVLISFLMKNEKGIRKINIFGAFMFVIYGVCINAFSVWFLNGALCLVHMRRLYKLKKCSEKEDCGGTSD